MFLMTLTIGICFLSAGTFSLLWLFRQPYNEFINGISDVDDDDSDDDDSTTSFHNISSHESVESVTYSPFHFEFKSQHCSKRVKTPVAFKQESEEKEREKEKRKEKNE
jgi:hypothetical protein